MKKYMFALIAMLTIAVSARAMSYEQARNEALFLTDKMAYELNLTDAQYEAAYEINLDYLMSVTSQYDVFGPYWEYRNRDLRYILYSWQWDVYYAASYFYRPLYWDAGYWHFRIYAHYPHRDRFFYARPHFFDTYRGAHGWRHNGGHSYYEGHRGHYRPDHSRESHVGMRDSYNRSGGGHTPQRDANRGGSDRQRGGNDANRGGGYSQDRSGGGSSGNDRNRSYQQQSQQRQQQDRGSSYNNQRQGSYDQGGTGSRDRSGSSYNQGGSSSRNRSGSSYNQGGTGSRDRSGGSSSTRGGGGGGGGGGQRSGGGRR